MKVKIFTSDFFNGENELENVINTWLEMELPEILFVKQSESRSSDSENRSDINITISFFYKNGQNPPA